MFEERRSIGTRGPPPGNLDGRARLPGGRSGFERVVVRVSRGVAVAVRSRGNTRTAGLRGVAEVVRSVLCESAEKGEDLALSTKAILVGVLRGTREKGRAALGALSETSRIAIHHSAELRMEVAKSARGCVLGAEACAPYLGVDVGQAVAAARRGALEAAGTIGDIEEAQVKAALQEK